MYIHDTPQQNLFQENIRTFSSGCIRLEKPMELIYYMLNDDTWDKKKIQNLINEKKDYTISLKTPIPVHIVYLTVWVDIDKKIHFMKDVYERDKNSY